MKKPETQKEMAVWLAENVLGWKYAEVHGVGLWITRESNNNPKQKIAQAIYSPEGFFAVWDVVLNMDRISLKAYEAMWMDVIAVKEENRYETFYGAIYKAMNQ